MVSLLNGGVDRGAPVSANRVRVVPLSQLALDIIGKPATKEEPAIGETTNANDEADWIFPSSRTGGPYRGPSLDHAVRDLFVPRERRKGTVAKTPPLANAEKWTPHDLRRTGATSMRKRGISRDDLGLVLNHASAGITGRVYDWYLALEEKRRASLWGRRLAEIAGEVEPSETNVTVLRASA